MPLVAQVIISSVGAGGGIILFVAVAAGCKCGGSSSHCCHCSHSAGYTEVAVVILGSGHPQSTSIS